MFRSSSQVSEMLFDSFAHPLAYDCVLTPWSSWSNCSDYCGQGSQFRIRSVVAPASVCCVAKLIFHSPTSRDSGYHAHPWQQCKTKHAFLQQAQTAFIHRGVRGPAAQSRVTLVRNFAREKSLAKARVQAFRVARCTRLRHAAQHLATLTPASQIRVVSGSITSLTRSDSPLRVHMIQQRWITARAQVR